MRSCHICRNGEAEDASLAQRRLDPYAATVALNDLSTNRQTQAGTLRLVGQRVTDLFELVEYRDHVCWIDADAGVANTKDDSIRILPYCDYGDSLFEYACRCERCELPSHLAGIELGAVEHIVDEQGQAFAFLDDDVDIAANMRHGADGFVGGGGEGARGPRLSNVSRARLGID